MAQQDPATFHSLLSSLTAAHLSASERFLEFQECPMFCSLLIDVSQTFTEFALELSEREQETQVRHLQNEIEASVLFAPPSICVFRLN